MPSTANTRLQPARAGLAAWIPLALVVLLGSPSAARQGSGGPALDPPVLDPPAAASARALLADAGRELARLGLEAELAEVEALLATLGEPAESLFKRSKGWAKELARDRAKPAPRALRSLAGALADASRELALELELEREQRAPGERARIARAALALDQRNARAGAELGWIERDGRWLAAEELAALEREARPLRSLAAARALAPRTQLEPSALPAATHLGFQDCAVARASGLELHGTLVPERLERVLRMVLQGSALSRALLGGQLEVPPEVRGQAFFLLDSRARYRAAIDEARASGGLDQASHALQIDLPQGSFLDGRGWWTLDHAHDGDLAALVLWRLMHGWVDYEAQPCLVAGHLNWICNQLFGVPMPAVLRSLEGTKARTAQQDALWRAAQRSTSAARLWALAQQALGRSTPFERCLQDQLGEVHGPLLVRSTLLVERLQQQGRLGRVVSATNGREDRVDAFEQALGQPLPELDLELERWLAGPVAGLVQRLEARAESLERESASRGERELLEALRELRAEALGAGVPPVELDATLSAGASAHARYLALNPDLRASWEDLHVERPERPGFDAAGARAGLDSIVHVSGDRSGPGLREVLGDWTATCLHRLPLLEPGLFGVGLGQVDGVLVLDVTSLVLDPESEHWVAWPPPGAARVPLAMVPEIPSPLPGVAQDLLGYPITLQVRGHAPSRALDLALSLHLGGPDGPPVEVLAVQAEPGHPAPIPPSTWCVIPARTLEPRTRYAVRIRSAAKGVPESLRTWSFETGSL